MGRLTRFPRTFGAVVLLGALPAAVSGCTTDVQDPEAPAGVPNRVVQESGGADAALEGRVAEIGGCFYIESRHAEAALTLAVFPAHEVEADDDGDGFTFLEQDYSDGDDITVGGSMAGPTIHAVPEECDDEVPQWLVSPSTPAP
ncbi:hypothetical protein [Nesterenkonia sandarakina]|uniref:Secreted protein n=1 Tax=Nesterenkonia sandarakina TaxID=272918 RepID=A0A7Z0E8G2_9MICC|nr:hypothetical protein [Nesterenkonia sandarakina]NYJ16858.1 hypothetical protein [Nesterenkonia sandarakina]